MKDKKNDIKPSTKADESEKAENKKETIATFPEAAAANARPKDLDTDRQQPVIVRSHDDAALIEHTHFADDTTDAPERKKTQSQKQIDENVQLLQIGDKLKEVSSGEFDYHVTGYIGRGGYGQVYMIEDNDHWKFALKLLYPNASNYSFVLEAFKQEVRIARGLYHNGLCKALEHYYDQKRDLHCCIMEYIDGISLTDMIHYYDGQDRKMLYMHVVFIILRVAEVLGYLSDNHIVHRDIKPQNIMISDTGEVKVLDLGIARKDDNSPIGEGEAPGTLPYMPLGQLLQKDPVDARVDIYSLGVVFFGLLTGRHPYSIPSMDLPFVKRRDELIREMSQTPTPNPRDFNSNIPERLVPIIMKMMEQDVEKRYSGTQELINDLREIVGSRANETIEKELQKICRLVKAYQLSNEEEVEKTPQITKTPAVVIEPVSVPTGSKTPGGGATDTKPVLPRTPQNVQASSNSGTAASGEKSVSRKEPRQDTSGNIPPRPPKSGAVNEPPHSGGNEDPDKLTPAKQPSQSLKATAAALMTRFPQLASYGWVIAVVALLLLASIGVFCYKHHLKNLPEFKENKRIYDELLVSTPAIQSDILDLDANISVLERQITASPALAVTTWRDIDKRMNAIEAFKTSAEDLKKKAGSVPVLVKTDDWVTGAGRLWNAEKQALYVKITERRNSLYGKMNDYFSSIKRKLDQIAEQIPDIIADLPSSTPNNLLANNTLKEYVDNVAFAREWYSLLPEIQKPDLSWIEDLNDKTKGSDKWLDWYDSLTAMKENGFSKNEGPKSFIDNMLKLHGEMDSFSHKDSFRKVYANIRENLPKEITKPIIEIISKEISGNKLAFSNFAKTLDFTDELLNDGVNEMEKKLDKSRELFEVVKGNKQLSSDPLYSQCTTNLRIMNSIYRNLETFLQMQKKYLDYRNDLFAWEDMRFPTTDKSSLKKKYEAFKKEYAVVTSTLKNNNHEWEFKNAKSQLMKMWDDLANEADSKMPEEIKKNVKETMRTSGYSDDDTQTDERTYLVIDLTNGKYRFTSKKPESWQKAKMTELWLRHIPAGGFLMGSPINERGREDGADEKQHEVLLTRDFYIGVFECTQKQWTMVMGDNDNPSRHKDDDHPVENVSIKDIRGGKVNETVTDGSFIGRLRNLTSRNAKNVELYFDLPTEAQWEYACRAETTTSLNSDKNLVVPDGFDEELDKLGKCRFQKHDIESNMHMTVGSYEPNAWGLYDMHGNVSEWCLDFFGKYNDSQTMTDPICTDVSAWNVSRGGGWKSDPKECRSASRKKIRSVKRNDELYEDTGFRVVCRPPASLGMKSSEE